MKNVPNLASFNVKGDNRNINDDQNMQKMTADGIEYLKDQGATG